KQSPHTIIVCCADSRVSPEIVFDALNLGQLFVVRVAGPALSQCDFDTVKYGVEVLRIKQIIVLGHTDCGAVTAVWQAKFNESASRSDEDQNPERVPTAFPCLYQSIYPSCVNTHHDEDVNIQTSMKLHVLRTKKLIVDQINIDKHDVYTAYYDLKSGKVQFFGKQ